MATTTAAAATATATVQQIAMEELPSFSSSANGYGTCNNNTIDTTTNGNPQQRQRQSSDEDLIASASTTQQSKEVLLFWRKPWMTALVLFFIYFFLWAYGVVIKRYWIKEDWDTALPGFGTRCVCVCVCLCFFGLFGPNHKRSKGVTTAILSFSTLLCTVSLISLVPSESYQCVPT
jgi:hypothetical protein